MYEDSDINLSRFRRHNKERPWSLIRKLLIAVALIGLLYYVYYEMTLEPVSSIDATELEIEMPD